MKQLIKKFYLIGLAVAIAVTLGMFIELRYYEKIIYQEIKNSIISETNYIESEITGRLIRRKLTIEAASSFIAIEREEEKILYFLKALMSSDSSFTSIYFGTQDNNMINASGWVPPKNFDLRERPWYRKAVQEDKFIFTETFLNASKDQWVISLAQPVYDYNHELLGVVAGDTSIKSILDLIKDQKISVNGYSFLIDEVGNVLAHTNSEYNLTSEFINIKDISESLASSIIENKNGVMPIELGGIEGYVGYHTIGETNWTIGSFVPTSDYMSIDNQILNIFLITLISLALVFVMLNFIQRKYIIRPLIELEQEIQDISVENNIYYRLPVEENNTFIHIRKSTNIVLEKTQGYFERMIENQEALKVSEERNRGIVNAIPDIVFVLNAKGKFLDCKVSDESQLLFKKEDFLGRHLIEIMPDAINKKALNGIKQALNTNQIQQFEYSLELPNGLNYYEMRIVKSSEDEVVAITRNISEQKTRQNKIEYLVYHDQLTDVYNRRFYEEELKRLDTHRNMPFTIAMLDVNGLKLTNDAFGHLAGDMLLRKIAEILKIECRSDDIIARIGGDEFVILLPKTTSEDTEKIIKRIHNAANNEKFENGIISFSIGWETKLLDNQSMKDILIKAEENMYRKKLSESQSMRNKTIQVILKTLNEKNKKEKIHSENVSSLSKQIGEAMNLGYDTIKEIEIAGLMHDIGKISINDYLLNKTGKLTEIEYDEIKKHPASGYQILKSVDVYLSLAEYVLYHHERWDGKGYPMGLSGNEIPLISRIITVADAYEAMISDRPYRKRLSKEIAIDELKKHSGTQFDSEIVKVFIEQVLS